MNLPLKLALRAGYFMPRPLPQLLAGREPAVLLYHGTPRSSIRAGKYGFDGEDLERQIVHLQRHFEFIGPQALTRPRSVWARKAVLLTFDDGLRSNAAVAAPILRKHRVPAIFFVSCRHVGTDRVLWFSYLIALEHGFRHAGFTFRGQYQDMSAGRRKETVGRLSEALLGLTPHPAAMYAAIENELPPLESFLPREEIEDRYAGLTEEQVAGLAGEELFSVGCHTVDHPFLTRCAPPEAIRQIVENKRHLERICGKAVTDISYPAGDYDESILTACRNLGMRSGYAVDPRVNSDPRLEVPRAGIYQPYPEVAAFKAMWARRRANRG